MNRFTNLELEQYILSIDATSYSERRNYIGGSTNLSEYITRGVMSLPQIRDLILVNNTPSQAFKLINELAWREYWQSVWRNKGDGIFEYIRPLPLTPRPGIPQAILTADTGIKALDEGITQLQTTGYIHNHMRLWLAGVICNIARCDWKTGADWMHSYLIDGDYASNHLSWQWVAGSYTGKPYLPQQDNINTYTESIQHNTYLDQPYSVLADMPIPEQLTTTTTTLPTHQASLPDSTITVDALADESEILLYSPWTLDPEWRQSSAGSRLLLVDSTLFSNGHFSQNVIDSIAWFAQQIPDLNIFYGQPTELANLSGHIVRKDYPGITNWPGQVDPPEQLYPKVEAKFYPSFSAFWKQTQKR